MKNLTVEDVEARIQAIKDAAGDDEKQHGIEDALYEDVLKAIAKGNVGDDPGDLCRAALKSKKIQFGRWMA